MRKLIPSGLWPLWTAGFVSTIGDSMHQVALMWLVYELTGSSTVTGLVGMSQYLPAVLVGLFAGAFVDRMNRKYVMIAADAARIVLVALIPILYLSGLMTGLILGLIAFSIAIFTTAFSPARDAITPQIVQPSELTQAGSVLQASYGFAYFIGPVLAAAFLPWIKLTGLFFADSASYLLSLGCLIWIKPRPISQPQEQSSSWKLLKEGLNYAKTNGLIRGLLLVTAVDNLFIMGPALVGAPLYVRHHLHLGAGAYAAVEGAFALGMITGSFLFHRIGSRLPRGKTLLCALMFDGITFAPFYFTTTLFPTLIVWFVHSIGIPFILVPRTTLIQTQVPQQLQGRVFSMINLTVVGLSSFSCALTGLLAETMPIGILYVVIGISATIVGAVGWLFRDLREHR
jgi:MFS transporter, DHA3 family, macrolide efflux protein